MLISMTTNPVDRCELVVVYHSLWRTPPVPEASHSMMSNLPDWLMALSTSKGT